MNNNFKTIKELSKYLFILGIFAFAFQSFAVWSPKPTALPNNNNIVAPINVGPTLQQKQGSVIVHGFRSVGPAVFDTTIQIPTSAGAGKVLTSDAGGNATWQTASGGGGGTWGSITGTLSNQTDLNNALNLKANLASPVFTGTPSLPTGTIGVTQTAGNNTTALATTAFVTNAVAAGGGGGSAGGWTDSGTTVGLTTNTDHINIGTNFSVIWKGANIFIHNKGTQNFFAGINAGNESVAGTDNVGVGSTALKNISNTSYNVAVGSVASRDADSGSIGNTASGRGSMISPGGADNTAAGSSSMWSNLSSYANTALGERAFQNNTYGSYNVGIGTEALLYNTTGNNNTAIGYASGNHWDFTNLTNITTIGFNILLNASNKVRIGNSSVTVIEGQVAWSYPSDLRLKENIKDSDLGLDFIKKLRPVSFTMKTGEGTDYGFIAQEVEDLIGRKTNIVLTDNSPEKMKTMRYTDLIAPLTKAVQEQQDEIKVYREQLEALKERLKVLESEQ